MERKEGRRRRVEEGGRRDKEERWKEKTRRERFLFFLPLGVSVCTKVRVYIPHLNNSFFTSSF
jgi:hypothetical protein